MDMANIDMNALSFDDLLQLISSQLDSDDPLVEELLYEECLLKLSFGSDTRCPHTKDFGALGPYGRRLVNSFPSMHG